MTEDEKSRGILLAAESLAKTCASVAKMGQVIDGLLADPSDEMPAMATFYTYGEQGYTTNSYYKWLMEYWGSVYQTEEENAKKKSKLLPGDIVVSTVVQFYSRKLKELRQAEMWISICRIREKSALWGPLSLISGSQHQVWDKSGNELPDYGQWLSTQVSKKDIDMEFDMSRQPLCHLDSRDKVEELVVKPLRERYALFLKGAA